jgi:tRNA-(ms[2]io[6]A)-hydroxylase
MFAGPLLRSRTDPSWVAVALADLPALFSDHLHCERKAAQSALSLVRSYPERTALVEAVARLAHEETSHVVQVAQLAAATGRPPYPDVGDEYAAALRALVRKHEPQRLLDQLLVFALIEARSAERLGLLAGALAGETAALYAALAAAEVRHSEVFLEQAAAVAGEAAARARAAELAEAEARVLAALPVRPRIH